MFKFLYMGGPIITFPLTLLLLINVLLIVRYIMVHKKVSADKLHNQVNYIKYIGVLAVVLGMLGQIIGLYDAFAAIEQMGDVSPTMFYGGMKVSSITTIYGFVIFLISYVAWLLLKAYTDRYISSLAV